MKINCYGDNCSNVYMAIKALYGWNGKQCGDIIKLNYNGLKREAFLTVKAINPGVGLVLERIIDLVKGINLHNTALDNPMKAIIEILVEKLELEYDSNIVQKVLHEHQNYMYKKSSL